MINFFRDSKKSILYLSSVLASLVLIALVVFIIQKVSVKKIVPVAEKELILNEKLLTPDAPYIQSDYITSRQTEEKWSEEEVQKWFTNPGINEQTDLHHANNKTVSDILGAAP